MITTVDPEREVAHRLLPLTAPAFAVAAGAGWLLAGPGAATSAAIAIAVVAANLAAHAASLAWAARISAAAALLVGVGGYVLRIATFTAGLVLLDRLPWFSPVAFVAAFVPATIALLALELRYLGDRRMQSELWYFRGSAS